MWRLTQVFAEIALHRRGPDDLPASRFLFGLILGTYLAVGFLSLLVSEPAERLLELTILGSTLDLGFIGLIILETFFYLLFVWVVLRVSDHSTRFFQTGTALLGAETLLGLIGIPILVWIDAVSGSGGEPTAGTFVYLLLFLWSVDVAGFILSRALQRGYFVGVLMVLGYLMISFTLRERFFPVTS